MKQKTKWLFVLLVCLHAIAHAQTGTVTVTASKLGGPFPITGTITFQPTLSNATPASAMIGGGGLMAAQPLTATVTGGAFTLTGVLDTSASSPQNVCYKVTITTGNRLQALGPGYSCVQPAANNQWCSSGICDFDNYIPSLTGLAQVVPGQKGDKGDTGLPGPSGNTMAGTTSPEAYEAAQNVTVTPGTTDEAPFLQQCVNNILYWCVLQKRSYYLGTTLTLPDLAYLRGAGMTNGTKIYSHVNGPAITMAPGPNQGLHVGDFNLILDPTLANSQGIVLEAQQGSSLAEGGLWNSTFEHIEVDNCALECLYTYTSGAPATINQFDTFNDITIQGPSQSHPNALWKSIGANNQFDRYKVSVNGDNNNTHYPNALEYMGPDSSGSAPSDVGCVKCTYQGGTNAINLLQVRTYSQYAGYVENVATPVTASAVYGLQFDWMDVRNSGYTTGVMHALGGVVGSFQHNTMDASATATQPTHGVACANINQINEGYNTTNIGSALSSGCGEVQLATAATLTIYSPVSLVFTDGGATPIQTITAPQTGAGKTVTIKAYTTTSNASSTLAIATGGNIDLNGFSSPLVLPTGTSATFRWRDLLQQWMLESTTAALPKGTRTVLSDGATPFFIQSLVSTNTGNSAGIPAGDLCTVQYKWTGSGATYWETAVCTESGAAIAFYSSAAANLGSEAFVNVGGFTHP